MDYDLRVFLEKGLKVVVLQRKIPILAAHNPEVVGSSPASATIKSTGFRKRSGAFLFHSFNVSVTERQQASSFIVYKPMKVYNIHKQTS